MPYHLFHASLECFECSHVYEHRGFPIYLPKCPECGCPEYEINFSGNISIEQASPFGSYLAQSSDAGTSDDYRERLTRLLFQLKNHSKENELPFIILT